MIWILQLLFLFLSWATTPPVLVKTNEVLTNPTSGFSIIDLYAGGGDSFGGGDSVDSRRNTAWFYGNQPIDTCIQLGPDFGLNENQVRRDISQAIQMWQNYFQSKQIGKELPLEQRVNTNFNLEAACEGGEDLVLYLGTGPIFANLEDLRMRQTLSRPVAYVNKTHMSSDLKWGKGYIRFVEPNLYEGPSQAFPRWNQDKAFYNIFVHELGHVLGFVHKDDTIMTKDISMIHFVASPAMMDKLNIDLGHELFVCNECESQYQATLGSTYQELTIDGDEVRINGQLAVVVDSVKRKEEASFLKFFPLDAQAKPSVLLYFIQFQGENYTLELDGLLATLRKDGQRLELFQKNGV